MTGVLTKMSEEYDKEKAFEIWCDNHTIFYYFLMCIGLPIAGFFGVAIGTFAVITPIALLLGWL